MVFTNIVHAKDLNKGSQTVFYRRIKIWIAGMLLMELMRCGIIAMALDTTGSLQYGLRICVSLLAPDSTLHTLMSGLAFLNSSKQINNNNQMNYISADEAMISVISGRPHLHSGQYLNSGIVAGGFSQKR